MFKQIKKRLINSIWIPALFAIVFSMVVICSSLIITNTRDYNTYVQNDIDQITNTFNFNVDIASSSIDSLNQNDSIVDYLKGQDASEAMIRTTLSNKTASFKSILGMAIYSLDNNINPIGDYNVSGLAKTDELLNLTPIKKFIDDNEKMHLIFIRNKAIHSSYFFTTYNELDGMCSLVNKIFDEDNKLIGFVLTDFKSDMIYNVFLNDKSCTNLRNSTFFVYQGNVTLLYEYDQNYVDEHFNEKTMFSSSLNFYVIDDIQVKINYSKKEFYLNNLYIVLFNLATGLLFMGFVYFIAKENANAICEPLENLARKMGDF